MKNANEIEYGYSTGIKSICYQCGTGSGKTRVIRYFIDIYNNYKKNIYLIAHTKNLVAQLSREVTDADIRHGIIAAGFPRINYRVQICSLQTLIRRIDNLPEAELIIIDECHHVKNKSYMAIIKKWNKALILGTTATPMRLDGNPLGDIFHKLIIGPPMRKLINAGYLSDYAYYAPDNISMEGLRKLGGEYKTSEVLERVDKKAIIGSAVDHYRKYADHEPAIVSCANIFHAEHVAEEFKNAGYKSLAVHSKIDQKKITGGLNGLKDGSLEILTQCELLGEGIDIPGATVLIGLRPTLSETIFLQHIGRVLRKNDGKEKAIILDHVGNWERHGMPDDERFWSLNGKTKNNGELNHKRCPDCIKPVKKHAKECPYCGHIWERKEYEPKLPEQKDGELIQITGNECESKISIDWQTLKEIIGREARTLKQAIFLAKKFGKTHRHGWYIWNKILRR